MDTEQRLQFLMDGGQAWILAQRDDHRASARMLTASEKAKFRPFFGHQILDIARIKRVPSIENPPFYKHLGADIPLDFTAMEGITFIDTILVSDREFPHDRPLRPLLFHELVHVVQYRLLGPADFIEQYVRGWARGGQDYYAIPLEKDAYNLQRRFENHPSELFSVEVEVTHRLGLN